ncbi:peptidylprolyl isomerase [Sphingomonas morindae]|uniref:peptidylprolyl isomerase n=1 Tax=Sphingomonas morindae TaxID=1541170 RepID=A0ABY4X7C5_9SPHN|nr:peptidylprolyl isomerase [Sphingomonas morindae]USI72750.1 peptidylprolyl isomerase [Sphingomonas morindae]
MIARLPLLLLAAGALAGAQLPPAAPAPAPPAPPPGPPPTLVTLVTDQGPVVIALDSSKAPVTSANFLRYVDQHRFDGSSFYRAVKVAPGYGLVQGGVRNAPKKVLPPIRHEPTSTTGLTHKDGTISMARAAPGTASGDFFIVIGDIPSMDADPSKPGDNQGFAAFGQVVQGMDLMRHLLDAPVSADGPAGMKGEMLAQPVKILSARRGGG